MTFSFAGVIMEFAYKFPVVRGVQAKREYFIAMVPLKMLGKLFPTDDEYVLPEYRAQRKLNENRVPTISQYILKNRENYVFSALSASIDGEFEFHPSVDNDNCGVLEVSMDAKFLINDGQHRRAAILAAINEDETLGDETISIVFFEDNGLARSQQMFTDLNKHAVKTSNSIAELYDSRDDLAVVTRRMVSSVPFLEKYTDKEKDILGKYSATLFTLNTIYNANRRIIKKKNGSLEAEEFLIRYWSIIAEHMVLWHELENREITKVDLREQYLVTQAVIMQALGRLGNYFYERPEVNMESIIKGIEKIDWGRGSTLWKQRVVKNNGRMINNETAIILACNMIKMELGIKLDIEEQQREDSLKKSVNGHV